MVVPRTFRLPARFVALFAGRPWVLNVLAAGAVVGAAVVAQRAAQGRQIVFHHSEQVVVTQDAMERISVPPPLGGTAPSTPIVVTGTIQNGGETPTGLVRVVATFLDSQGEVVWPRVGYASPWSLAAGQEAPFRILSEEDPRIVAYRLSVDEGGE